MGKTLLDLGTQPLANNLCDSAMDALAAPKYSLRAEYDKNLCISLDTEIPPEILYKHYLYKSGVSAPYVKHCEEMYQSVAHNATDTIIDIGGNDGTLLRSFQRMASKPLRLINVDASVSFKEENESYGIEYVNGLFSDKLDLPKANLIVSTNVFQHTKDIHSFLTGIQRHLDGIWILEFPYALSTLLTHQFDQFYHEHYYYWLITPLEKLFEQYGLKIIFTKQMAIHGGTMRMWMTNKEPSSEKVQSTIDQYKRLEAAIDFEAFNDAIYYQTKNCQNFIQHLKGRTAFFGAAAKGCVFLNATELSINNMPDAYIIDDTPGKQGKFMPGTGFEICPREKLLTHHVDNIIILAHNFADYIAPSLRAVFNGRIYTCLPTITEQ